MRIAIVNWSSRKAGGAETYLHRVIGGLHYAGHETALFCETDQPVERLPITLPQELPHWSVSTMGLESAISALRTWRPEVIYAHGLSDPGIEGRTLEMAPGVLFAHNYYGTCISGGKTFKYRVVRPCARRFGWPCLAHFYPHRCGGLSPLTMWSSFRRESHRFDLLHSYRMIITASEHMRLEYLRHGLAPDSVKVIPYPVEWPYPEAGRVALNGDAESREAYWLLFVGRMELLKGGHILLDALPLVLARLDRPLQMTFVGDGRERASWEKKAANIQSREPRLKVQFTGWLEGEPLKREFAASDLLVVPSLWPEPFGLVGPEAGLHGLPAVAFEVGGISEWLTDGVNGYLAPGHSPAAEELARAILKCLREPAQYARLRINALETARRFSLTNHINQLTPILESVACG